MDNNQLKQTDQQKMSGDNASGSVVNSKIYEFQSGIKKGIMSALGVIIGVAGMIVAFLVSLLNSPEGGLSLKDKVSDVWFWIIWAVIFAIATFVVVSTYRVTKKDAKNQPKFIQAQYEYKIQKDLARPNFKYLPRFTQEKNREIFSILEREVVESADLNYEDYKMQKYKTKVPKDYNPTGFDDHYFLSKDQIKQLRMIKKIRINKIYPKDLTQEYRIVFSKTYSFLPEDEVTAENKFMRSGILSRILSTFAFLIVGSLTFAFSGWISAITNAFGILMAWIGAIIQANEYVDSVLRARYNAKSDLLTEFNSVVELYIESEKADELANQEELKVLDIEAKENIKESGGIINATDKVNSNGVL